MSMDDDSPMNPSGEDEILAAEFVLGVLDADEREQCARRMVSDAAFAEAVRGWEERLSALNEAYRPESPPAGLFDEIERKIHAEGRPADAIPSARQFGFWNNLALWRIAAIISMIIVVVFAGLYSGVVRIGGGDTPPTQLIASLQAEGSPIRFAALYDAGPGIVRISTISGEIEANRDFELWFIIGTNAPVSLGVLPRDPPARFVLTQEQKSLFTEGTVLAVSLEPAGGSPTGAPTGPVVAAGSIGKI